MSRARRAQDRGRIALVNGDVESLQQVVERVWISSNLLHSVAKLTDKDIGLRTRNTTGLNGHWSENMVRGQMEVFGSLPFSACAATVPASTKATKQHMMVQLYQGTWHPKQEVCPSSTVLWTLHQASSHLNEEGQQVQGTKES